MGENYLDKQPMGSELIDTLISIFKKKWKKRFGKYMRYSFERLIKSISK